MRLRLQRQLLLFALLAVALVVVIGALSRQASGQTMARNQDDNWTYYGGNTKNWKYRAFDQINATNFSTLQVAWRFKTDNMGPQAEYRLGATPLMVNGVVYAVGGGMRRSVVALEADTGAMLWVHSEDEGLRAQFAPRVGSGRGVAYWTDGKEERILYVTTGYRLKALNAKTGALIPSFGKGGVVDLKLDFDQDLRRFAGPSVGCGGIRRGVIYHARFGRNELRPYKAHGPPQIMLLGQKPPENPLLHTNAY